MKEEFRPWFATILSVIIPGLGHLYLKKYAKGLLFILLEVMAILTLQLEYAATFVVALEIWVSFDAYVIALKQNQLICPVRKEGIGIRTDKETDDKEKRDIYV